MILKDERCWGHLLVLNAAKILVDKLNRTRDECRHGTPSNSGEDELNLLYGDLDRILIESGT